ncbi:MAG: type II secretion system F family protein [Deltaproteobacteria bacterium]|nr:type II secretion system F family protein [Deltaproteobacteria bacterium]
MDSGLLMTAIASALVGVALAGLGLGVRLLRRRSDPLARRLRADLFEEAAPAVEAVPPSRALQAIGRFARGGEREASRLRQRLIQAGHRRASALQVFLAAKVLLALGLPLAFLAWHASLSEPLRLALPIAVWLCAGGFYLPNLWLAARIAQRRAVLEKALPDALDLLVTCVEAGLGLDAALLRVSQDSALCAPELADELNLTFLEVRAGIPRTEAFRRLFARTGCDELKSLAATLAQSEMFGTSVGVALRVQAQGIRTRRMYRAEERAAVVAVKLTVPLVLCILPSLISVVVGPAAVNIYQSLYPALGGP